MIYLLLVSFLPFATDLIGDHKDLELPCVVYASTLLALSTLSFIHIRYLARHPALASAGLTPAIIASTGQRIALLALVPLVSMIVAIYSTHAALYVYLL